MSLERLTQDANGDLVYTCTHPWFDGTTGMRLSPMELVEKLAAAFADMLVHAGEVGRGAFEDMLAAVCVSYLPLPAYTVTLPSRKRWPNNSGTAVHVLPSSLGTPRECTFRTP